MEYVCVRNLDAHKLVGNLDRYNNLIGFASTARKHAAQPRRPHTHPHARTHAADPQAHNAPRPRRAETPFAALLYEVAIICVVVHCALPYWCVHHSSVLTAVTLCHVLFCPAPSVAIRTWFISKIANLKKFTNLNCVLSVLL